MCVCIYVFAVNTITKKITNILTPYSEHTFAIAQGRVHYILFQFER